MDDLLRVGDPVMHKLSRRVGIVSRFAHNGTTDVFVDDTGPYPQDAFVKLQLPPAKPGEPGGPELPAPDADGFTCHCPTFSSCTHK
jgi:hypothetical protein